METYYSGHGVDVYLADYRDVLPQLGRVDSVVTDPPYGVTALPWDRWPDGWPQHMAGLTDSLWSFLPMRVALERGTEFAGWRYAQDLVWEKHNGSGFTRDRFRRVHEHAIHWYRGAWKAQHRAVPLVPRPHDLDKSAMPAGDRGAGRHVGAIKPQRYVDDGTRLMRSVLRAPAVRYGAHPTEKPQELLQALIQYSVPPGGTVLDPMAGSLAVARAAIATGRRAIVVEVREQYAEAGVQVLEQDQAA